MVSKASEDLPAPEGPVTTVTARCGTRQSIPLRLCVRARWTRMSDVLAIIGGSAPSAEQPRTVRNARIGGPRSWTSYIGVSKTGARRDGVLASALDPHPRPLSQPTHAP